MQVLTWVVERPALLRLLGPQHLDFIVSAIRKVMLPHRIPLYRYIPIAGIKTELYWG